MKRCIAALLAALMLLPLVGCSNWDEELYADDPLSELSKYYAKDEEEETPVPTTFTLPCLSGESVDPITCGDGVCLTLSALLYEPLYRLTPEFETERVLARSESYDAESFTYTIQLRSGVRFSDGTSLTAQDVADTLTRAMTSARYAARLVDVVDVRAVDSSTLTIRLSSDRRTLTSLLDIPIVKSGTETVDFPTGTGPYAKVDGQDTLRQNENWWRSVTLPFDEIDLLAYKNEEAAAYGFAANDVHLLAYDMTGTESDVASTSGSCTDTDTTILQFLGFNTNRRLFQDENVRRAISMTVNRTTIVSAYMVGHGVETQFPINPASALYPQSLEQSYTAEDCTAAMEAVGMADGEWYYNMTLLVNSESSFKMAAVQEIAAALEQYDFKVTIKALPWEQYLTALAEGSFDMYYGECKLTADWDITQLVGTGGTLNYGGYSDQILDIQLAACLSADEERRGETLEALCRRLQTYAPIIPVCFKRTSVLLPYDLVDTITPTATDPFYGLENWTVHWTSEDE